MVSSPRHRLRVAAFMFGATLGILAIAAGELVARQLDPLWDLHEDFLCRDLRPGLGGGFRPNCHCRWIRKLGKTKVFDIGFHTDEYGRRVTPQTNPVGRHKLALFAGCSFTAGAGVEDAETLPARFAALAMDYHVLNLGASGFGPQQALAIAEDGFPAAEVGDFEGDPLLVYTMIPGHVSRAVGSWLILGTYGRFFPSYVLDGHGHLLFEGTFADAHPWRVDLAQFVADSALLHRLSEPRDGYAADLTAHLLFETSRRFKERFQGGRFIVFAYPGMWHGDEPVLARMHELGLTVLEAPELFRVGEPGLTLLDGHPTALSYRRAAAWLADELQQRGLMEGGA